MVAERLVALAEHEVDECGLVLSGRGASLLFDVTQDAQRLSARGPDVVARQHVRTPQLRS